MQNLLGIQYRGFQQSGFVTSPVPLLEDRHETLSRAECLQRSSAPFGFNSLPEL